jgi:hypothetical protein
MLSAGDWQLMRDLAAQVRSDRSQDVELRRGDTTLDPQEMRIEAVGRGSRLQSDAARESKTAVVIFGDIDLDIAVDDRFTLEEMLFQVVFVSVNRDIDTQAEAVAVR